jgi:cytoskeleton protein RodZ
MPPKRRRSTKNTEAEPKTAASEETRDVSLDHVSAQPVTVAIPESPVVEPVVPTAERYRPVDEPPSPPPQPEKPVVIRRSAPERPAKVETERLGEILRRVRFSRRENLDDIADYLRIRPSFLAALENSQYDLLPADAYVIGFLRTYAAYLGLDGRAAIDQYRREMSGRRRKPQLSMPQPVSEGPAPTIAILVSAALAALLLYILWYVFASSDRAEVSAPPPLPPSVAVETPAATPAVASTVEATNQPASTSANVALATETAPAAGGNAAAVSDAPQPAAPAAQSSAASTVPASAPAALPAKPAADEKGIAVNAAQAQATTSAETKAEPTKAEPAAPENEEPVTRAFGAPPARARVAIRAVKNSWVLVADERGNTVFDRTLKPGEVYYVPSGKALTLTTGNGKGLKMSLDGVTLPTIGADGNVVRGLPLEADKLRALLSTGE